MNDARVDPVRSTSIATGARDGWHQAKSHMATPLIRTCFLFTKGLAVCKTLNSVFLCSQIAGHPEFCYFPVHGNRGELIRGAAQGR